MPYSPYVKGKKAELYLGKLLLERGFFVMRAPASGRRARRFHYPDLVAIRQGKVLLFEVKLRKHRDTIHLSGKQYENLIYASKLTGGKAYLAVYVVEDKKWHFFDLSKLSKQTYGNVVRYVLTRSAFEYSLTLDNIVT